MLGPALLKLSNVYLDTLDVRARAMRWTAELARRTGCATRLGVPLFDEVIVIHHNRRPDGSEQMPEIGVTIPAHASALGKVLLAYDPNVADPILAGDAAQPHRRDDHRSRPTSPCSSRRSSSAGSRTRRTRRCSASRRSPRRSPIDRAQVIAAIVGRAADERVPARATPCSTTCARRRATSRASSAPRPGRPRVAPRDGDGRNDVRRLGWPRCDACSSSAPPARSAPRRSTSSGRTRGASRSSGCRRDRTARRCRRRRREFDVEHTALGADEAEQLVRDVEADVVLNGITGSVGLGPDARGARDGPDARARQQGVAHRRRRPRDRAIARPARSSRSTPSTPRSRRRCARGEHAEVRRLVLTASGGPFRGRTRESLADVTPAEALAHPTWDMGRVVTTNSATLVNKGLEVIEAHLLFGVPYDRHRRRRASAVDRALDGGVRRRLDDRPGVAARHAAADLARTRLAAPGRRSRAPARLDGRDILDLRAARRGGVPGRAARQAASAARAAPTPPSSTRPTSRPSTPSTRAGCRSRASSTPSSAIVDSHEAPAALTRETLAEAERWARDAADRAIAASAPADPRATVERGGVSPRAGTAPASAARARASPRPRSARRASSRAEYGVRTPRMSR